MNNVFNSSSCLPLHINHPSVPFLSLSYLHVSMIVFFFFDVCFFCLSFPYSPSFVSPTVPAFSFALPDRILASPCLCSVACS